MQMRCWFSDKDGTQIVNKPKMEMPPRTVGHPIHHYRKTGSTCVTSSATNPYVGNVLKTLKPVNATPTCMGGGSIQSFSGTPTVRPASTIVSSSYYSNRSAYLKSRQNYQTSASFHKQDGVTVSNYTGCQVAYHPSNSTFQTQGGVSSSDMTNRLIYDTITANNASFVKPYGLRFAYTTNPLWFVKMDYQACNTCPTAKPCTIRRLP